MITIYTLLIIAAVLMHGFFASSEMAITSLNRIRLNSLVEKKDPRALKLKELLGREGSYLGATLVGTNIAMVIASGLATRICAEYFGIEAASIATTLILVPVTLVFAEIVPKMIARQRSTDMALSAVGPLMTFSGFFHPLIVSVNFVAGLILAPFGKDKTPWDVTFTKKDLKRILVSGHASGHVEADEMELIHRVLDFGNKKVDKIMVPLYRLSSISRDDTVDSLKKLVSLTGFSRIPIHSGKKSDIVGVVNIYEVLFAQNEVPGDSPVSGFMREPVCVKRSDGLNVALTRLRNAEQPMGIVTDADESVVGIVTIEDILEEIVGDIEDGGARI